MLRRAPSSCQILLSLTLIMQIPAAMLPASGIPMALCKGCELPVQRESFDVIGKVGFGRDFQASKDIDNPVNTFQQLTDDLEESMTRIINPWRKYSLSKVWLLDLLASLCSPLLFCQGILEVWQGFGEERLMASCAELLPFPSARIVCSIDAALLSVKETLQSAGMLVLLSFIILFTRRKSWQGTRTTMTSRTSTRSWWMNA